MVSLWSHPHGVHDHIGVGAAENIAAHFHRLGPLGHIAHRRQTLNRQHSSCTVPLSLSTPKAVALQFHEIEEPQRFQQAHPIRLRV